MKELTPDQVDAERRLWPRRSLWVLWAHGEKTPHGSRFPDRTYDPMRNLSSLWKTAACGNESHWTIGGGLISLVSSIKDPMLAWEKHVRSPPTEEEIEPETADKLTATPILIPQHDWWGGGIASAVRLSWNRRKRWRQGVSLFSFYFSFSYSGFIGNKSISPSWVCSAHDDICWVVFPCSYLVLWTFLYTFPCPAEEAVMFTWHPAEVNPPQSCNIWNKITNIYLACVRSISRLKWTAVFPLGFTQTPEGIKKDTAEIIISLGICRMLISR